jgi:hypothetical protein
VPKPFVAARDARFINHYEPVEVLFAERFQRSFPR